MNGKLLKNSILQWAIQGKLVPQEPNDEPASVLLERIRAEKARLVKEGKIKKGKNESIIYRGDDNSHYEKFADGTIKCIDDEIPFEIPQGWEWCRLNDVCSYIQRGKSPVYSETKLYPVIAQKCNQLSGFSIDKAQFIAPETVEKYTQERILQENDLLWNSTGLGTLGRIAVYVSSQNPYGWAVADSHVTVIRPLQPFMNSFYLYEYFSSPTVQSVIEDKAEGSTKQKELYVDTVKKYLIPLPPLNEQTRIVEKIDTILPIVAKYGMSQDRLDELNGELNDRLRKSILQEAIQGHLVPQDPNDEPASALLDRIRDEKQKLLKEGKIKKKDIVDSVIFKGADNKYYERIGTDVIEIDLPFQFPESWAIVRLQAICTLTDGERRTGDGICLDAKYLRGKSTGDHLYSGKYVHSGDNIILVDGENSGEVFTAPIDGYMGSTFKQLWVSKNLHLPYVLSCIRFYKDELRNSKKGAAIPHLNKDIFRNLLIGIPPSKEQVRIVNKLSTIDSQL